MNNNMRRPPNAREQMIKQGYTVILIICGLIIFNSLSDILIAFSTGINPFSLIITAVVLWLCWSLYSGQIWARYLLGARALLGILNSLFWMFGGTLVGEGALVFAAFLSIPINIATIYLLFFFQPVQEYMRYIGGETL